MAGHVFGTLVLVTAALFSLFTTWTSATAPAAFAEQLGLSIANAGGTNEIRAQYAGFFLAVAIACVASIAGVVPRQSVYLILVVVFGGLITGRAASLLLNHGMSGYGPTIMALYAIDATGLALSLAALSFDGARG